MALKFTYLSVILLLLSCSNRSKLDAYKKDLLSDSTNKIVLAAYELGEARDTSAVKLLLNKALDPRISHDIRFKGMTVAYCKLIALKKISNINYITKDQFTPDTNAANSYLEWALTKKYIKNKNEIDLYYYK